MIYSILQLVIVMRRQFKSKRRFRKSFIGFILLIVITLIININLVDNLSAGFTFEKKKLPFKIDFDKEKLLLYLGLNRIDKETKTIETEIPTFNEVELPSRTIYIYNTHQTEEYKDGNILDASKQLKQKLEENNINVILETTDIAKEIRSKGLLYKDSYKITRSLLEKNKNDNISLYIDLHRDSSSKKVTTTTIDEKSYAKVMFVIGGKHETYKDNYRVADELNKLFKNYNKTLTRGIYVRKSSSYNQDLANNVILIELGGQNNTMEEINNTINVLADIIIYYIGE